MKIHTFEVEVDEGDVDWERSTVPVSVNLAGVSVYQTNVRWMHGPDARAEAEEEALSDFARRLRYIVDNYHDHCEDK